MDTFLTISQLQVSVGEKTVLHGVDLVINQGTVHAIMGPNGSGKSSLAYTLMGHPRYEVKSGSMQFEGDDLNELPPHKRAKLGIFLAMQHPFEVEGVPYKDFLRQAYNALYDGTPRQLRIRDFHAMLLQKLELLKKAAGVDSAYDEPCETCGQEPCKCDSADDEMTAIKRNAGIPVAVQVAAEDNDVFEDKQ